MKFIKLQRDIALLLGVCLLSSSCAMLRPTLEADHEVCRDCNVVFISLTNLRADHLGLYGYHRNTSPQIDAFAKNAIVFENAFSVASWTLPAVMSVYTSLYPFTHKVMARYQEAEGGQVSLSRLPETTLTLVDLLNKKGYETVSFNSLQDYQPRQGLTDRLDYNFSSPLQPLREWAQYGLTKDVVPPALEWIEKNSHKKFFLHLQAYNAHCPFAYPRENNMFDPTYKGGVDFSRCYWTFDKTEPIVLGPQGREKKYYNVKTTESEPRGIIRNVEERLNERDIEHMVALYDGEIFDADAQIGRIIEKLKEKGLMNKTIIVFFSEHGDMFGKYGRFMRGGPLRGTFYDDVLHVPLVIYHPHLQPRRVDQLVSLIDIAPAVLDFLGISQPSEFQGRSLVHALKDHPEDGQIFAGALFTHYADALLFRYSTIIAAVRDKEWKLIRETLVYRDGSTNTNYELFNVKNDPEELNNVAQEHFEELERFNHLLTGWIGTKVGMDNLLKAAELSTDNKRGHQDGIEKSLH